MPPILKLYKITATGLPATYFLAHPNTYQGIPVEDSGVDEATEEEAALAIAVNVKNLLKSPLLDRVVIYIKKADGKRTTRQLVMPSIKKSTFAVKYRGKPITIPSGSGTVISVLTPRHKSRF